MMHTERAVEGDLGGGRFREGKQSAWYEQEKLLQAPFLWQSQHNCVRLHF